MQFLQLHILPQSVGPFGAIRSVTVEILYRDIPFII
jgi:hypothetical protein